MLSSSLSAAPQQRPAVVTVDGITTWSQLNKQVIKLVHQFQPLTGGRVGLLLPASAAGIAALCALDQLCARTFLLDESLSLEKTKKWAERFDFDAMLVHDSAKGWVVHRYGETSVPTGESSVTILTSGTEGEPKAATYSWDRLAAPVRTDLPPDRDVWLLTYRIHLYAGLQVVLQALLNGQTLVIATPGISPDETATLMTKAQVTCASATPSYWRRLMLFADAKIMAGIPLRQITLGGETADQAILDTLRATYPNARVVHIYATTELGRCFAVADGREGFPVSFMDNETPTRGVDCELKIEDGQLMVRPTQGMNRNEGDASQSDWTRTGDLVEIDDDRARFVGRAGDMINVGGNKVRPAVVESFLRTLPDVLDARVYGMASSIAGQLVACDIVPTIDVDEGQLRVAVLKSCRSALQPYELPRLVTFVREIEVTSAGKVTRTAPSE